MSTYLASRILKPRYFRLAPLKRGRSNRITYVIGFDSEAEHGVPFCLQFGHPNETVDLLYVEKGTNHEALSAFLGYLWDHCKDKTHEYIVVGFNLNYEYTQWFRDLPDDVKNAPNIDISGHIRNNIPFRIRALNYKREAMSVYIGNTKRPIKVIDGMAYIQGSLNNVSKMLGFGAKKETPPFKRNMFHDERFRSYAIQDAILTQKLGQWIVDQHREYDVPQTISAPHFASNVFRRAFLNQEIPLADEDLEQYGLSSYHGGKNGFYRVKPERHANIHHVDITSAYPEAMRSLPNVEHADWLYDDTYTRGVHAIWHITGYYRQCRYRSIMDAGTWARIGPVNTYLTSYELDAALQQGEIELETCEGFILEHRCCDDPGPLVRYVDTFFRMKAEATDDSIRTVAKLFLNSLYGKFFQKTPNGSVFDFDIETGERILTDSEQDYDFTAGGLYHPAIASLITGYVRARIHNLEHSLGSLMTSTDGLFAFNAPDASLIGKHLGGLTTERGTLILWRERLYHFRPDGVRCNCKRRLRPGEKPSCVVALHGFRGTRSDLLQAPLTPGAVYRYMSDTMIGLRMSTRVLRGHTYAPGTFVALEYAITMPGGP